MLNRLQEDASGLNYDIPTNKLQRLYDFYFLTMHMSSGDNDKTFELTHAMEKLYNKVKEDVLNDMAFSIYSEIFHAFNSSEYIEEVMDDGVTDVPELQDWVESLDHGFVQKLYDEFQEMGLTESDVGYKERNNVIRKALTTYRINPLRFMNFCKEGFVISYLWPNEEESGKSGGESWEMIAEAWIDLYNTKFDYADNGKKLSLAIDGCFDLQHNSGNALDKIKDYDRLREALDFKRHAANAKEYFPLISKSLISYYQMLHFDKNKNILDPTWTREDAENATVVRIRKDPMSILYIQKPTIDMIIAALEKNPDAIYNMIDRRIDIPDQIWDWLRTKNPKLYKQADSYQEDNP
jgi:hypothetical protein